MPTRISFPLLLALILVLHLLPLRIHHLIRNAHHRQRGHAGNAMNGTSRQARVVIPCCSQRQVGLSKDPDESQWPTAPPPMNRKVSGMWHATRQAQFSPVNLKFSQSVLDAHAVFYPAAISRFHAYLVARLSFRYLVIVEWSPCVLVYVPVAM